MSPTENNEHSDFFDSQISQQFEYETDLSSPEKVFRLVKYNQHRKWVVKKSLNPPFQSHPAWQECLRTEFETGYKLNHPNLIQYYHLEEKSDTLFLIREWVDGQTLADWAARPHAQKQRLSVLKQILEVTHYLHQHLLYHRDLSPYNILITHRSQQVKILDFGFAAMESETPPAAGTPYWSAPEQLKGASPAPTADVYSIGKLTQLLFAEPKPTAGVKKLITACLMQRPEDRPATLQQAIDLLNHNPRKIKHLYVLLLTACVLLSFMIWAIWPTTIEKEQTHTYPKNQISPKVSQDSITTASHDAEPLHKSLSPVSPEMSIDSILDKKALLMAKEIEPCFIFCDAQLSKTPKGRYKTNALQCLRGCIQKQIKQLESMHDNKDIPTNRQVLFERQYNNYAKPIEDSIRNIIFNNP